MVFHREQLAGTGEAALHLVGNQQNTVGVAQGAQRLHKISWRNVETALSLNRFENNGRDLVGCDIRFKDAFQAFQRFRRADAVQFIRILRVIHRTGERAKAELVRRNFAGQRHGHKGAAVERAAEGDKAGTFGVRSGNFDRVFDRLCPRGEERGLGRTVNGHALVDALGKRHIAFVRHNLVRRMGKRVELFFNRGNDFWMAMAGIQHRDPGGEVDVLVTFHVPHRGVFSFISIEVTHHADAARRRL